MKEIQWHRNRKEDWKNTKKWKEGIGKALDTNGQCAQGLKIR